VPVEAFIRDAALEAASGPAGWVVADPAPTVYRYPSLPPGHDLAVARGRLGGRERGPLCGR
jgi:hypothetical protein